MKGFFITFEGGEGSGKTTIIEKLYTDLINLGFDVVKTREPGGIAISEQIRNIILDVNNTLMTKETETLLYAASRMQHLSEKIIPALEAGKVVICDRYIDSSLAYQGYARGVGMDDVLQANHFALKHLPDLTLFIDVPPLVGLERIKSRSKQDRLDLESINFHDAVYNGYKQVCNKYKDRIEVIDGTKSKDEVYQAVIDTVLLKLKK